MQAPADSVVTDSGEETALRTALAGGFRGLRRLPATVEADFRNHTRARATLLLRQGIYGLIALYLLVVVPIMLFSHDPAVAVWRAWAMAPIGLVLTGLWVCTRLPALDRHVEALIGLSLFICLCGTLYCALRLDGQYFGRMAAYETIYILIVALTILQLPPRIALGAALAACAVSLTLALGGGLRPSGLEMLLFFAVPLLICLVTGYILDYSERRSFVQNLLLTQESHHLAQLHAAAEETMRQQRHLTEFLTLISGNLSPAELLNRSLRFLVEHSGAQVGAAYLPDAQGLLHCRASWAVSRDALRHRDGVAPEASLMGPALKTGEPLHLQQVRADYLPLDLGMGSLPCAALLVLPIVQAGRPLAVIELGRLSAFGVTEQRDADSIRTHLAYALLAALSRSEAAAA